MTAPDPHRAHPGRGRPRRGAARRFRSRVLSLGLLLACAVPGGCAQWGTPEIPAALRGPGARAERLFLTYHPESVMGFGHLGVVVREPGTSRLLRYDQYASSEVILDQRQRTYDAHVLEGITYRLPAVFGFTRERVIRRSGDTLPAVLDPWDDWIPVRISAAQQRAAFAAAEARWRSARRVEQPGARTYYLLTNNCQHFVLEVLRAARLPAERYFPKPLVKDYIRRYRRAPPDGRD